MEYKSNPSQQSDINNVPNISNLMNQLITVTGGSEQAYKTIIAALTMAQFASTGIQNNPPAILPAPVMDLSPIQHPNFNQFRNNSFGGFDNSFNTSTGDLSVTLGSEIPREEIECDLDAIICRTISDSLSLSKTSLGCIDSDDQTFFTIFDNALKKVTYPVANIYSHSKRSRTSSIGSDAARVPMTPPLSDEEHSAAKKTRLDLNDSSASSCSETALVMDVPEIKEEKADCPAIVTTNQQDQLNNPLTPYNMFVRMLVDNLKCLDHKKPKLSLEYMNSTYHSNMARHFPGSEMRSEAQQVRRAKNTIAARNSRHKNKHYEETLRDQSSKALEQIIDAKRQLSSLQVYASELMKIGGIPVQDPDEMWEENFFYGNEDFFETTVAPLK